jgi:hypothetical protein
MELASLSQSLRGIQWILPKQSREGGLILSGINIELAFWETSRVDGNARNTVSAPLSQRDLLIDPKTSTPTHTSMFRKGASNVLVYTPIRVAREFASS